MSWLWIACLAAVGMAYGYVLGWLVTGCLKMRFDAQRGLQGIDGVHALGTEVEDLARRVALRQKFVEQDVVVVGRAEFDVSGLGTFILSVEEQRS